jgi:hypothetical protein
MKYLFLKTVLWFVLVLTFIVVNNGQSFAQITQVKSKVIPVSNNKKDTISLDFELGKPGDIYFVQVMLQTKASPQFKDWTLIASNITDKTQIYLLYRFQYKNQPVSLSFVSKGCTCYQVGISSYRSVDNLNPFCFKKKMDFTLNAGREIDSIPIDSNCCLKNNYLLLFSSCIADENLNKQKPFDVKNWGFNSNSKITFDEIYNQSENLFGIGLSIYPFKEVYKDEYVTMALKKSILNTKSLHGIALVLNPSLNLSANNFNTRDVSLLDSVTNYNIRSFINNNIYKDLDYDLNIDLGEMTDLDIAKLITACEVAIYKNSFNADTIQVCKNALYFYKSYNQIKNARYLVLSNKYSDVDVGKSINLMNSINGLKPNSQLEKRRLALIDLINNYKNKRDDFIKEVNKFKNLLNNSSRREVPVKIFNETKKKWEDYPYLLQCFEKALKDPENFDINLL